MKVDVDVILDYIAANVFDYWHGLGPTTEWTIPAIPLMDSIREHLEMSRDEFSDLYDIARFRAAYRRLESEIELPGLGSKSYWASLEDWMKNADRDESIDDFIRSKQ